MSKLRTILAEEGLVKTAAPGWTRESFYAGSTKEGNLYTLKSSKPGRMSPAEISSEYKVLEARIKSIIARNRDEPIPQAWSVSKGRNNAHALAVSAQGSRVVISCVLLYRGSDPDPRADKGLWK